MPKSQLKTVLFLADLAEKEAAKSFSKAQADLVEAETNLEQVKGYRYEYEQGHFKLSANGLDSSRLQISRQFMVQLDKLIEHQSKMLSANYQLVDQRRDTWLKSRANRKGLESIILKRTKDTEIRNMKADQRLLDDLFSNRVAG
ncbi:flagellar export protein FliJ [Luminiphilus sp.]|nr:flagellar export protein FliJ [Luminiphilus sp.]